MMLRYALSGAAMFLASITPCHAGSCSPQIDAMQVKIDARLDAQAAAGPAGKEATTATAHAQPTPKSIAEAEVRLGDISASAVAATGEAMARARKADIAGDAAGCEADLADAEKALGN
jgi:hypothetical protein